VTEYADIDQINALKVEQTQIGLALTSLDDFNGTVPSCLIVPTTGGNQAPPAVSINMAEPPQAMLSGIRAGLIQRYNQINQELRDLGVTDTPPNHQGGGPPIVETQPA